MRSRSYSMRLQTAAQMSQGCWRWGKCLPVTPQEFLDVGNALLYSSATMLEIDF
jgi:hypothetical protein